MTNLPDVSLYPLGDAAIVIQFGDVINRQTNQLVHSFSDYLGECEIPGMIEQVPAFTTVTVFYNIQRASYSDIERKIQHLLTLFEPKEVEQSRLIEIPVHYGGEFGPDLAEVAAFHGLTQQEIVNIHADALYTVYAVGFSPGFPYLGGLNPRIATPRRESPRLIVPVGTVGIAGSQTGIYPMVTPGGWQMIGQTPLILFSPDKNPPSLLRVGDRVKFLPVSMNDK